MEQGVAVNIVMWRGLAAPKGTPPAAIEKLQNAAAAAVASNQFQEAAENIGFTTAYLDAQAFGALIAKDDAFYGNLLKELGLAK
jgi:tripartite-type tricarboxylate transporter receptor subunit TctC